MSWDHIAASFDGNVNSVRELLDFDQIIIETAVEGLRSLARELEQRDLHRAVTLVNNRADMLENIKTNNSLRPKYEAIHNQCVVLLVSYFDSATHAVFRAGVIAALRSGVDAPIANEALSVSWRGLERTEGERESIFADLVVAQKNISFQDMKSVGRAFNDLLGIAIAKTPDTDNIILGHAARHVIVHASSTVDEKMIKQISGASARSLKLDLGVGRPVRFDPEEISELADSMKAYLRHLCSTLSVKFGEQLQ